ncbi:MAG TPA: thioredoxin family protein [Candidatus Binatia bacterium]|nr:thioredoxin family protein [Candidatus Binatia bacterium]
MKMPWVAAALLLAAPSFAESPGSYDAAVAQSRARRAPLLADFSAPWCYSCYYMARNVLTGPEWDRVRRDAVVLELDADSPEGAQLMKQWSVKALPTYVVFAPDGRELGRILGEQTRADFYAWLNGALARGDTLESLKARVADGSDASLAAAREVLKTFHARYDAAGGLDWFMALAPKARAAVARDSQSSLWLGRLELLRASKEPDTAGCLKAGAAVLDANLGCERPYELDRVMACTEKETGAARTDLLRSQVELMQLLLEKRVLADNARCADERSVVVGTADLEQALGDTAAEKRVLDRAIENLAQRIGPDLKKDRNQADNLRVYLERAQRWDELDALLNRMIQAWPDDYVYAYREGKTLAARGRHAEALPYFEKAAAKAYGANRLRNAELRASTLHALGKDAEARQVIAQALQANGPQFPEEAAKLRALPDQWQTAPAPAPAPAPGSPPPAT